MKPVRLEPTTPRSGVKHSTTEPLLYGDDHDTCCLTLYFIEIPFNAFANRADPYQVALVRAA